MGKPLGPFTTEDKPTNLPTRSCVKTSCWKSRETDFVVRQETKVPELPGRSHLKGLKLENVSGCLGNPSVNLGIKGLLHARRPSKLACDISRIGVGYRSERHVAHRCGVWC